MPGVAPAGVTFPVAGSIFNPTDGCMLKVPPLSPVKITSTAGALVVLQKFEGSYFIEAAGAFVMVTVVEVSKPGQGGEGFIVYFTV